MRPLVSTAGQSLRLDAGLHQPDVADLRGGEPVRGVPNGFDDVHEGLAEVGVSAHRAGPQQRLELPGGRPALVVGRVRGQAAHQRPGLALGTQVVVEAELGVRTRGAEQPAHLLDDEHRPPLGLLVGHARRSARWTKIDVGVRRVPHLAPPRLPIPMAAMARAERRRRPAPPPCARRCSSADVQGRRGQVGQRARRPRRGRARGRGRRWRSGAARGGAATSPPPWPRPRPAVVLAALPEGEPELLQGCAGSGRRAPRGWRPTRATRTRRSAAYRLRARTRARRSADEPSSRSILRYQWVVPSSSLTRRKASSPASGSASSANQPSITGSRVRWIAARRVTPEVSASRWRIAPAGSRKPSAARRARAASGVSEAVGCR